MIDFQDLRDRATLIASTPNETTLWCESAQQLIYDMRDLLDRYHDALASIAEHPIVRESKNTDDVCDWHCATTLVATAKLALNE